MNFNNYFLEISKTIQDIDHKKLNLVISKMRKIKKNNKKIILAGNGGSAAMASHVAVDLTKNAKIRAINFNEADLITCFANDFGYENWLSKAIEFYYQKGDMCILISSSGKSKNILKAADFCKKNKIFLVTLSGFKRSNALKKKGDLNFWVDHDEYNIVEMTHHIWLLAVVDSIIGLKI